MNDSLVMEFGLWELAVLAVLKERPMHPYEIQRLLKLRHKDDVLVLKRGSLYHAIRRVAAADLIRERETTREGRRPERTSYEITRAGEAALSDWLKRRLEEPREEPSSFMGSLSFLVYLSPAEAVSGLERRSEALQQVIAGYDARLALATPKAGRINVVESEYIRAMRRAELKWIRELIADIREGRLTWDIKAILRDLRALHAESRQARGRRPRASGAVPKSPRP